MWKAIIDNFEWHFHINFKIKKCYEMAVRNQSKFAELVFFICIVNVLF